MEVQCFVSWSGCSCCCFCRMCCLRCMLQGPEKRFEAGREPASTDQHQQRR